jgi:hypothetical protein
MKHLHSIYQLGGVSSPGISDIDIVLICDDTLDDAFKPYRCFLDGKQQYIAGHISPVLVSKRIFEEIPILFYLSSFHVLYGETLSIEEIARNEAIIFRLCYSIDAALSELLWLLDRLTLRVIPIRPMLCHLYSVKYDIKSMLDIAGIQSADGQKFIEQIQQLRLNWFNLAINDAHEKVVSLAHNAVKILIDIVNHLGNYLTDNYCSSRLHDSFYLADAGPLIHFSSMGGKYFKHELNFCHSRFLNSYLLRLTIGAGLPILLYSEHNSLSGWRLRRHIIHSNINSSIYANCNNLLLSAIKRKMDLLQEYRFFLSINTSSMSFFEGPWWNNSRLYKIKHFFWRILLS